MPGPLAGIRVLEFAAIGPVPYCGMLLADLGADVVVMARTEADLAPVASRGKASVTTNLKTDTGRELALEAMACADIVLEGFRPGVMERLGLGPEPTLALNPRLIYGRMTGWGQTGPLAAKAGHDINYVALTGALDAISAPDAQARPPLNLLGDFGGGSLFLLAGVLAALVERVSSGRGQVVDAAIVDGVASLMAPLQGFANVGFLALERGRNPLAGYAPNYRCYTCADGKELAVGAIEPQFRAEFFERLGVSALAFGDDRWAAEEANKVISERLATRPRDEWIAYFADADACVAPVLTVPEAIEHPHNVARNLFVAAPGGYQPAVAPRFSRTPGAVGSATADDGAERLRQWRLTNDSSAAAES